MPSVYWLAAGAAALAVAAFPVAATRTSPPPGLEARAVKVGAEAPGFELPRATGGTFSLADARKGGPVVLVFYRGSW